MTDAELLKEALRWVRYMRDHPVLDIPERRSLDRFLEELPEEYKENLKEK
jgi:hypothetical protein